MKTRYRAILVVGGEECGVFPRRTKRSTFTTIQSATSALEHKARSLKREARGLVKDRDGNVVLYIAL